MASRPSLRLSLVTGIFLDRLRHGRGRMVGHEAKNEMDCRDSRRERGSAGARSALRAPALSRGIGGDGQAEWKWFIEGQRIFRTEREFTHEEISSRWERARAGRRHRLGSGRAAHEGGIDYSRR